MKCARVKLTMKDGSVVSGKIPMPAYSYTNDEDNMLLIEHINNLSESSPIPKGIIIDGQEFIRERDHEQIEKSEFIKWEFK